MACDHYELNMSGARFGDCKCGHAKAEHSQAAQHAGPSHHHVAPHAAPAAPAPSPGDEYHGPCEHYAVDMNASEFGLCKCGFKKIDHGKPREQFMTKPDAPPSRSAAAPAPPPAPVEPEPAAPAPVETSHSSSSKSEFPCNHFEIDVKGTFGFCKCGHSREEHKQAGTIVEPELRVFAGGHAADSKRPTISHKGNPAAHKGKQDKPCDNYSVDMNGKTFGDCLCGHGKAKHKQFQAVKRTANVDPDEEEVVPEPAPEAPRVIIRDGQHPCEVFELDLKNTGGYGHCICGFSRLDHEQFHHDPEEWQRVKDSLTAPKEFT